MTLDEADKIVKIWGKHVEYFNRIALLLFGASAPESILPFPKNIIQEACNMVAEHHHNNGNLEIVRAIESCEAFLLVYNDDAESLLQAAKLWNDPKWRENLLPALKQSQADWIKTQKNN